MSLSLQLIDELLNSKLFSNSTPSVTAKDSPRPSSPKVGQDSLSLVDELIKFLSVSTIKEQNPHTDAPSFRSSNAKICGSCQKENPKAKICQRCKLVNYCNRSCQTTAWKTHKLTCKAPELSEVGLVTSNGILSAPHKIWDSSQFKTGEPTKHLDPLKNLTNGRARLVSFTEKPPLDELKEDEIKQLASSGEYADLMDHIKTSSVDSIIQHITPLAEAGHPLMQLELSKALNQKMEQKGDYKDLKSAFRWYFAGIHGALLDLACNTDESSLSAIEVLQGSYNPECFFSKKGRKKMDELNLEDLNESTVKAWKPSRERISPKWGATHGIQNMLNINSLKPEEEWVSLRQKRQEEILSQFKTRINLNN